MKCHLSNGSPPPVRAQLEPCEIKAAVKAARLDQGRSAQDRSPRGFLQLARVAPCHLQRTPQPRAFLATRHERYFPEGLHKWSFQLSTHPTHDLLGFLAGP